MAPPLVPIPAAGITASYDAASQRLTLGAKGTIPGYFFDPIFVRDKSAAAAAGGLRYSLGAYSGGLGRRPSEKSVDVSDTFEDVALAEAESVVVVTSLGEFTVEVERQ